MTIKEAILKSLETEARLMKYMEVYDSILKYNYYTFTKAKTPTDTVGALLGDFIRNGDNRVKRVKIKGQYHYYLSKLEPNLDLTSVNEVIAKSKEDKSVKTYAERDLHILLSSYLQSISIHSKTIFHESSKNSKDGNQKWVHPDMIGIQWQKMENNASKSLLKTVEKSQAFKLFSYELKREINSDYELKKCFFQAVSNSSWANYGYLVAFDIGDHLHAEIERLNQSFGIGVIELSSQPFESKVLFPSRLKQLNYKTIDKLCNINPAFATFISNVEKSLDASDKYVSSIEKELLDYCDDYLENDGDIRAYCKKKNIPFTEEMDGDI